MPDPQIMMVPIASRRRFALRMLRNAAIAAGVVGGALAIGMTGYHQLGGLGWVESFYYASMILSGEGPPLDPQSLTSAALQHLHLFAGFYALFSGVTFITMVGVLFAPAIHRFLHKFHLEIAAHDEPGESS
jgi:xanthine/uracil permease